MEQFKSGFVSIIGRPNVGKSTLLNALIGEKISIMTSKPQTTRTKITGILNDENSQIIFIDTPGIHKPKHKLGIVMNETVNESIEEVDLLVFIVEADSEEIGKGDEYIINKIKERNLPCILVINKIDKIKRDKLLALIDSYMKMYSFDAVVPLSALKNDGVKALLDEIKKFIPYGPKYYAADEFTDQTERQIIEEIVREKALKLLDEEVPHGIVVELDTFKVKKKRDGEKYYNIEVTIYCERNSHKGIIIGAKGTMLKRISTYARQDIEKLLGMKVNLKTWVKVKDDWRDNEKLINKFFNA
ncbi:MAG: GTPase Era [Clostridiales bacterium]|nr:GTPase Era [Clostridiales bacterium]